MFHTSKCDVHTACFKVKTHLLSEHYAALTFKPQNDIVSYPCCAQSVPKLKYFLLFHSGIISFDVTSTLWPWPCSVG